MAAEYNSYGFEEAPLIETASATTSPTNSNSGNLAFIIAGIAVALNLIFGLGMSGCMALIGSVVEEDAGSYSYHYYDSYDYDTDDFFNDDELDLDHFFDTMEQNEHQPIDG